MSIRKKKKAKAEDTSTAKVERPTPKTSYHEQPATTGPGKLLALLWGIPIVLIVAAIVLKAVQA